MQTSKFSDDEYALMINSCFENWVKYLGLDATWTFDVKFENLSEDDVSGTATWNTPYTGGLLKLNKKWFRKNNPPPDVVEETIVHELLHFLLHELWDTADKYVGPEVKKIFTDACETEIDKFTRLIIRARYGRSHRLIGIEPREDEEEPDGSNSTERFF